MAGIQRTVRYAIYWLRRRQPLPILLTICCLWLHGLVLLQNGVWADEPQPTAVADEATHQSQTILFTTAFPEILPTYKAYRALYTEAFRRLGYRFQIVYHPDVRALTDADSGRADGTAGRIREFNAGGTFPNLIMVDESVRAFPTIALAVNPNLHVAGWEGLGPYKITYVRGNQYLEKILPQHVSESAVIPVSDFEQALRFLTAGRVDIYLELKEIEVLIKLIPEFKQQKFVNVGLIDNITAYPYLHRKHHELIPRLAAVLKKMKIDGTFRKLVAAVDENQ